MTELNNLCFKSHHWQKNLLVAVNSRMYLDTHNQKEGYWWEPDQCFVIIFGLFSFIMLRRIRLSVANVGQWSRKFEDDSTSRPPLHNGFKESWKLCFNLCSCYWLRPTLEDFYTYRSVTETTWMNFKRVQFLAFLMKGIVSSLAIIMPLQSRGVIKDL